MYLLLTLSKANQKIKLILKFKSSVFRSLHESYWKIILPYLLKLYFWISAAKTNFVLWKQLLLLTVFKLSMIQCWTNWRRIIFQNYSYRIVLLEIRNVEPCLSSKNLQYLRVQDKALEIHNLKIFKENSSLRQILHNIYYYLFFMGFYYRT